jgi:hypothetical protein
LWQNGEGWEGIGLGKKSRRGKGRNKRKEERKERKREEERLRERPRVRKIINTPFFIDSMLINENALGSSLPCVPSSGR